MTTETMPIQIHPSMYFCLLPKEAMNQYIELIIRLMHRSVFSEEYEKAAAYKRIFDYNNKRVNEGIGGTKDWASEDTDLASLIIITDDGNCALISPKSGKRPKI